MKETVSSKEFFEKLDKIKEQIKKEEFKPENIEQLLKKVKEEVFKDK